MSDYDDNDDLTSDEQQPESSRKNNWRRELEREAEQGREAAAKATAEAATARKELAFLKAGIDLNGDLTPQQKLFVKAYDGDVTPDAVKAAASEYGVIDPPAQQVPAEELAAHDRFAQASAGSVSSTDEQAWMHELDKAETEADVLDALRRADPSLLENGRVSKWVNGGNSNTPMVNPL